MPGKRILPAAKEKYFAARMQGHSVADAAHKAGFSKATGDGLERERRDRRPSSERDRMELQRDPLALPELSDEAKRALNDFAYFQRRYFGRVPYMWQVEAAEKVVELLASPDKEYLVVNCPPGVGKDLAVDTPLPTPHGWTTMGQVTVGDFLLDERGLPCMVTYKSELFTDHECYEVRSDDGASVIAGAGHEWPARLHGYGSYKRGPQADRPGKRGPKAESTTGIKAYTTEFLAKPRSKRPVLQMSKPLHLAKRDLPIDPYVLGAWLGDGDSTGGSMTSDVEDSKWMRRYFEEAGFDTTDRKDPIRFGVVGLTKKLRLAGLQNNKHIPAEYLHAAEDQRRALLQGLIDTDGHVRPDGLVEFTSTKLNLAEGVQYLVRSLGAKAGLSHERATLNGRDCGPKHRVTFRLKDSARLPRKALLTRDGVRTNSRYLTVTKVATVPTQCLMVDSPNHLFLCGRGLLVTHNTTLFTHDIPAWITVRNRQIRGMMGAATTALATRYTNRLRRTLSRTLPETSDDELIQRGWAFDAETTLADDFGRFQAIGDTWTSEQFVVQQYEGKGSISEKEPTWSAYGQDAGFIGGRFNFVVWDDLVDPKKQKTVEAKEDLQNYWDDVSEPRLEPGGLLILQGQRLASDDLYRYCLDKMVGSEVDYDTGEMVDQKPKYHHILYKAHYEEKCNPEVTHRRDAPNYPEGCLLSGWRLPWREINSLMTNRAERFEVVYQQQDSDPASVLVRPGWIHGHDGAPGCTDPDRDRLELPTKPDGTPALSGDLVSVMTVDPSPTKFWAILWWIYQPSTEMRWLMDLERRPMQADEFLDFNYAQGKHTGLLEEWRKTSVELGYPITHVIVEDNAAQRFLLQYDHVRRWMALTSVEIIPHSTHRNKSDPEYGVETIAQHYQFGRIRLPYKRNSQGWYLSQRLIDEVTHYPHGRTDDIVMAHWFLEWNLPRLYTADEDSTPAWRPSWAKTIPDLKRGPPLESRPNAMLTGAMRNMR